LSLRLKIVTFELSASPPTFSTQNVTREGISKPQPQQTHQNPLRVELVEVPKTCTVVHLTRRSLGILPAASSLARACRLLSILWYCLALT